MTHQICFFLIFPDKTSGHLRLLVHCLAIHSLFPALCTDSGTCFITRCMNPYPQHILMFVSYFVLFHLDFFTYIFGLNKAILTMSVIKTSLLGGTHLLGLAAFVVHLHISLSRGPLVQLIPPISPEPVTFGDALSIALVCNTHTTMIFCIR